MHLSSLSTRWSRFLSAPLSAAAILRRPRPDPQGTTANFAGCCLAIWGLLSLFSLARHYTYHSAVYDLGIFHQVLWNTSHLRFFETSLKQMSYLGDHFSPTFALLAPLEWLPRPLDVLLVVQAGTATLTAWNMYQLALLRLADGRAAWLIGLGTLLQPALFCPTNFDIHPEIFMAAALSRALYDLERERLGLAALWLLLVLGGKEDAGLVLGPLGLVLALEPRRRLFGLLLATTAFTWSGLAIGVLMPHFRPPVKSTAWFYLGRYAHLGSSVRQIVWTVLLHPLTAIWSSISPLKVLTALLLLGGWLGAPLRGGWRLLALLPIAGAHFLSARAAQFHFAYQYLVPIVPLLGWAAIAGAPYTIMRRPQLAFRMVMLIGVVSIADRLIAREYTLRQEHLALKEAIALIPPDVSVCIPNRGGPFLAARRQVDFCVLWEVERQQYLYYGWPQVSSATWQLFNLNEAEGEFPTLRTRCAALRRAGAEVHFDRDDVVLLRVTPSVLSAAASGGAEAARDQAEVQ